MNVTKLANVVQMSDEMFNEYLNREPLMTSIRLAPVRRKQRLAEETYWVNNPDLDNRCVVRGDN